jgi:hypothetical protein
MMPSQRKLSTLFFLLIISICVSIPAFAFQNEPDGFRGIKWGTNISELLDMSLSEDRGDSKFYLRKGDKLKIGDADIDRISYGFYKGRFNKLHIIYKGSLNFTKLKDTFFAQYGPGIKPNRFMEQYYWVGETLSIAFEHSEITNEGKIVYTYDPVSNEKEADSKEKAKEGAKDL